MPDPKTVQGVYQIETVFDDIDDGIGPSARGQGAGPHPDGKHIDADPEEPLLPVGGTHQRLPEDVAYQRQHIQHDGHLEEPLRGRLVEAGNHQVEQDGGRQEDRAEDRPLPAPETPGLYLSGRIRAPFLPLGKAHLSESELEPRVTKDPEFTVLPEPLPPSSESDDKENDEEIYEPLPSESSKPTSDETIEEPLDETDLPDTEPENTESNSEFYNSSEISVLIVDDDKELCDYVASEIGKEYKVMTANSGNAAWKLILTGRPSIVVTDLMMPDGDGYDLCRRIKANPETDYIAVIVLTSESNEDTQLRTMALQADHFLPKPFNLPLLRSAITQVLRVRESIRNKMRRTEIGNNYGSIEVDSYEDQFIQRVRDLVLKHIDDTTFNVNELSKEIGMSRVHLNRKLKEHFGISPIAYIRSVRLKQAAYLLVNNKVNISEVAYRVGFSSHSYFTSIFHDFFGMSPKEFVATYADNLNDETLQKLLE